jgi:hypothetical protein
VVVANGGDRPIQVGSHFHFYETNPALQFERAPARGMRLDIAAGTAVRFEPGQRAPSSWSRWAATASCTASMAWWRAAEGEHAMSRISRQAYAEMYGPTTGDRIRLADTALFIEIERDYAIYGEEVKFGGGKVIRDGMGQSQRVHADVMDTVITNAVIVDHWGIVKADIGIKDGASPASARPATRTSSRA